MVFKKRNPIETIQRWKTIAGLAITGYGLFVYGVVTFGEWLRTRKDARKNRKKP